MANEHLQRIPLAEGNRSTYTWSGWIKRNQLSAWERLFSTAGQTMIQLTGASPPDQIRYFHQISGNFDLRSAHLLRDVGSWMHLVVSVDHTHQHTKNRVRMFLNGAEIDNYATDSTSNGTQNLETYFNSMTEHSLLGRETTNAGENFRGEAFDIFWVDGQALTPEVFGFYKDGDGYQSSGTDQATDFRSGQWSPRLPKSIKHTINRGGGFGVNGFYLPLNDSSNLGADFHCTPNSIIKLKGEDEPQPRNGAPTTSDAYVSQLRSDPFAANLVLAIPGISTATGSNLITNGNFDSDISGWTASGVQFSHTRNSVDGNTSGKLMYFATGTNSTRNIYQNITTETGKRYTLSFDASSDVASANTVKVNGTSLITITDNNNGTLIHYNTSFTAASTSTEIKIESTVSNRSYYDNFVVKQEDAPRDYSADIKGSGSNLTVTANNQAGVGYEIPSYYGSAMTFDGDGDYLEVDTPVLGTGDWTIEEWIKQPSGTASQSYWDVSLGVNGDSNTAGAASIYHVYGGNGSGTDGEISFIGHSNTYRIFGRQDVRDGCWHHVVVEKYNNVVTLYIDGVRKDSASDTHDYNSTNNTMIGVSKTSQSNYYTGQIQDVRVYIGVAKYKGGFDVSKPYSPQSLNTHNARGTTCKNNFVTMNPLSKSGCTLSNGNLTVADSSSSGGQVYSTMGSDTGKWYYEAHITAVGGPGGVILGINPLRRPTNNVQNRTGYRSSGDVYNDGGSVQQTGTSYTTGDIIGVAWDADNKKLWFAKNGSWVYSGDPANGGNQATAYTNSETQGPSVQYDNGNISQIANFNFGQNPTFSGNVTAGTNTDGNGKGLFKYAPPTGFLALCDDNLPTPAVADPGKHFKTVLWKGNGTTGHAITGLGFKPDLVWIFNRDRATYKPVFDTVRGAKNMLRSNQDVAQGTFDTVLQSFDSDGFTVGNDGAHNYDGERLSAWCWKAGGPAVTNNDGSLSSQVSANQEAGFSIVKFTAQTSSSGTVGHGLGKKPAFWIWKDINGATGWYQYHQRMGASAWLQFDAQLAVTGNSAAWGGVEPTDTVFTHGQGLANQNDIIMYIWAEIQGYSKFGNYIGNGANEGPHVYCGFKPAWLLIKKRDGSGDENWRLFDSSRCPINQNDKHAVISSSGVESTESGIDLLSNGFKVRHNDGHQNQDGSEYIFAAFAESPFQTANAK